MENPGSKDRNPATPGTLSPEAAKALGRRLRQRISGLRVSISAALAPTPSGAVVVGIEEGEASEDVLTMRAALLQYLESNSTTGGKFLEWLQGHLPISSSSEEPYVWILRGLPTTGVEREIARCKLGQWVARFLDNEPEIHRPGQRPDQIIHNLLMLAASLAPLPELISSLNCLFNRLVDNPAALDREYRGFSMAASLRTAMVENATGGSKEIAAKIRAITTGRANEEIDIIEVLGRVNTN